MKEKIKSIAAFSVMVITIVIAIIFMLFFIYSFATYVSSGIEEGVELYDLHKEKTELEVKKLLNGSRNGEMEN